MMCVSNLEFIMTYFPFVGRKKPEIMIEFAEKKSEFRDVFNMKVGIQKSPFIGGG